MGEETRVGISSDRIVALIAALLMVGIGINSVITDQLWILLFSIVSILLGIFVIIVLNIFEIEALKKIPYGLWILALVSAVLVRLCILGVVLNEPLMDLYLLTTILMLCATLLNVLKEKASYVPSKVVVLVGSGFAIYESALLFVRGEGIEIVGFIFIGIIGILLAAILIISMSEKINVPFAWWLVLIIGFIFFWVFRDVFYFGWDAGIVILVGFILMIFAY